MSKDWYLSGSLQLLIAPLQSAQLHFSGNEDSDMVVPLQVRILKGVEFDDHVFVWEVSLLVLAGRLDRNLRVLGFVGKSNPL